MNPKHLKLTVATVAMLISGGAIATTATIEPAKEIVTPAVVEETKPKITTETTTKTIETPYQTSYIDDANLPKGQTKVITKGQTSIKAEHYTITYEDGIEIKRELDRIETSREPTTEVIARGTYVPPQPRAQTTACQNGTYVNSAGNTVCRPSRHNNGNATAICADGTYSYSQSRRGTCLHHGGVSSWL